MSEGRILPPGWVVATIGDLIGADGIFTDGDWVESKDQDPNGDVRLIQLADVGDGQYTSRSSRFLTSIKAGELGCTFLARGDLLIARMPDPLGRACIFPGDPKPAVTVVDVCIVRSGQCGVDHRWLMWTVNSPQFRSAIGGMQSGSTRKRISRGNLAKLRLPVPPVVEQRRIVAAIEEHLSDLDSAVAGLERARAKLAGYALTVCRAAVAGVLVPTEHGSAETAHADEAVSTMATARGLPRIPSGWAWVPLPHLGEVARGKSKHRPRDDERLYGGPYPFIQTGDVRRSRGRITMHSQSYSELGLAQSRLWPSGTLCITIAANIAETGILTYPACFPDSIVGFVHAGDPTTTKYVELFMRTVKDRLAQFAPATAQKNINLDVLSNLLVPVPPLCEQRRIVAEVERRLAVADRTAAEIDVQLTRAARLRQSILKRAFQGKLVPQDPNDEPASVLLERIRAARAARDGKSNCSRSRRTARAKIR